MGLLPSCVTVIILPVMSLPVTSLEGDIHTCWDTDSVTIQLLPYAAYVSQDWRLGVVKKLNEEYYILSHLPLECWA